MTRRRLVIAKPCEAQNVACPGAHACLYHGTGHWRICVGAILEHDAPRSNQQRADTGQELAA